MHLSALSLVYLSCSTNICYFCQKTVTVKRKSVTVMAYKLTWKPASTENAPTFLYISISLAVGDSKYIFLSAWLIKMLRQALKWVWRAWLQNWISYPSRVISVTAGAFTEIARWDNISNINIFFCWFGYGIIGIYFLQRSCTWNGFAVKFQQIYKGFMHV